MSTMKTNRRFHVTIRLAAYILLVNTLLSRAIAVLSQDIPPADDFLPRLRAEIAKRGYKWKAAQTSISQLPPEQRRRLLGVIEEDPPPGAQITRVPPGDYPSVVDWRDEGHLTDVRNQGNCGSCAAFGTAGAIEARMEIAADKPRWNPNLSEAQLFFCSSNWSCDSGSSPSVLLDYARDTGVAYEACFPHNDVDQPCNLCNSWMSQATKIDDWHWAGDADAIKAAVAQGPVEAVFTVYEDVYHYDSGIYRHIQGEERGGHAVTIVGYNDTENYWICKNSWGTGWGKAGYFRIAYGECRIDDWAYVPDVDLMPPTLPTVSSSSHTPSTWSQDDTVDVTSDNYTVEGYSYAATLSNGSFEVSWMSWHHDGEMAQSIVQDTLLAQDGEKIALLRNAHYNNIGGIPVGSARLWKTLAVPNLTVPKITIWYRIYTHNIVWVTENHTYYDTFEIYIDTVDWNEATQPNPNDPQHKARCRDELGTPDISQAGLVFCDGKSATRRRRGRRPIWGGGPSHWI
jgi:C1A family cysteine protease